MDLCPLDISLTHCHTVTLSHCHTVTLGANLGTILAWFDWCLRVVNSVVADGCGRIYISDLAWASSLPGGGLEWTVVYTVL